MTKEKKIYRATILEKFVNQYSQRKRAKKFFLTRNCIPQQLQTYQSNSPSTMLRIGYRGFSTRSRVFKLSPQEYVNQVQQEKLKMNNLNKHYLKIN